MAAEEQKGGFSEAISSLFSAGMGLNPYVAVGQSVLGLGQKIGSWIQRRNARKDFTNMQIPSSVYTMINEARSLTKPNVPWMDLYRANALGSAARAVEVGQRTSETASGTLGVLGNVYGRNYMDFERNLALKGLEERRQGKVAYMQALAQLSDWEHMKWQYNELMPYYQKMNLAGQMDMAANQNIGSSLSSMMRMGTANWEMAQRQNMFQQWRDAQLDFIKENNKYKNKNNYEIQDWGVPNYDNQNWG